MVFFATEIVKRVRCVMRHFAADPLLWTVWTRRAAEAQGWGASR